ncbi:Proline-rich receptor-like protein kinase PERK1, partial [Dichanthelium oligosanthes]
PLAAAAGVGAAAVPATAACSAGFFASASCSAGTFASAADASGTYRSAAAFASYAAATGACCPAGAIYSAPAGDASCSAGAFSSPAITGGACCSAAVVSAPAATSRSTGVSSYAATAGDTSCTTGVSSCTTAATRAFSACTGGAHAVSDTPISTGDPAGDATAVACAINADAVAASDPCAINADAVAASDPRAKDANSVASCGACANAVAPNAAFSTSAHAITTGAACTSSNAVASRGACTTTAVPCGASTSNDVRASSGDASTTNAHRASTTIAFAAFSRGARATSTLAAFSGDAQTSTTNALPTISINTSATVTFAAFPGNARAAKVVSAFSSDPTATPTKAAPVSSRGAQTATLAASCTAISSWAPPCSSWPTNGTVIGVSVAVATVVVLGLIAGLIYYCSKKRRQRRRGGNVSSPSGNVYGHRLPVTSSQQQSHSKTSSAPLQFPEQAYSSQQMFAPSWQTSSGALSGPLRPPLPPPPVIGGTVSYADLAAATGGFSDANLLGQGGFGHVYRGTLEGAGEVAIKRLRPGSGQGDREFHAEVEIISRVHHRHLVSLVGYCIHGDQRLLVYEYVPNKTLELHLHGGDRPTLDWHHRWRIALGSAKGLAYLHEDCDPKIIHRDIKAANILLDYNFDPKVSDFGLAKIQPADDTHVSTRVMGTFGYLAPEYATTGKVTDRSDVYSFGVVLLELITGRRPVLSSEPYNDETLVSWSRPKLTRALEENVYNGLIDPSMGVNYDAVDMQRLIACAAAAVRHTARSRPRMSQIVRYLEGQLSMEALNAGVAPGQSEVLEDHAGEQLRLMRRLAFVPGTSTRGFMTGNMSSSYVSEPTSEYGLDPSSSSSDDADSEMASAHRAANRPPTTTGSSAATGTGVEGQSSGEIGVADGMSRRVRPSGRGGA